MYGQGDCIKATRRLTCDHLHWNERRRSAVFGTLVDVSMLIAMWYELLMMVCYNMSTVIIIV